MTNLTYFTLGAISLALGLIIKPYVDALVMRIKRLFTRKKQYPRTLRKPYQLLQLELTALDKKVSELEEQMNNVAQNSYRRETNRKNNIRRAVREYLEELKNG